MKYEAREGNALFDNTQKQGQDTLHTRSNIRLNSVLTLVANAALALSNWSMFILIAKHYSSEALGSFVLALSIASTGLLLSSFKLRTLLIVDVEWKYSIESYAMSRVLANSVVTLLCVTVASLWFSEIPGGIFFSVLAYKLVDSASEFCHSYARRNDHFDYVTKVLVFKSVVSIITIALFSIFNFSLFILLLSWLCVAFVFALYDMLFIRKLLQHHSTDSFTWSRFMSRRAVDESFGIFSRHKTIAIGLVVSALFVYLPNFMLTKLDSLASAGIFASISYFLVAGGIVINSLSQAATPTLTRYIASHSYEAFSKLTLRLCFVGAGLGVIGVVISYFFGAFFLELFYTPEVAKYSTTLTLVMLAALIRYIYIFIGTSLSVLNQFSIQTNIYLVGLFTLFFAGLYLIPAYGLLGVGWSFVVATTVELILFIHASFKIFALPKRLAS